MSARTSMIMMLVAGAFLTVIQPVLVWAVARDQSHQWLYVCSAGALSVGEFVACVMAGFSWSDSLRHK